MSNRPLNLKLNAQNQAPDYLPSTTSFLISANKCQTPSSSWTHPFLSLHISHSNQQQILLSLLLKSSHPPVPTWSKTLPFLTWIILLASKLISLFSSLSALVLNLNTTVQMCHLKGKPDHATLLHLTWQKIRSPNNGLQGTPPSGPIPPSLSALRPTTLPLAHSVLNSKAHSCFKEVCVCFPLCPKHSFLQMLQDGLPHFFQVLLQRYLLTAAFPEDPACYIQIKSMLPTL